MAAMGWTFRSPRRLGLPSARRASSVASRPRVAGSVGSRARDGPLVAARAGPAGAGPGAVPALVATARGAGRSTDDRGTGRDPGTHRARPSPTPRPRSPSRANTTVAGRRWTSSSCSPSASRTTAPRSTDGDDGLPRVVATILAGWGVRRLVVPAGLPTEWLGARPASIVDDEPPLSVEDLDATDAVITSCAIAIAETGTIVLDASPGQGRRALSLLPDRHLCVVDATRIVGTVPEALARLDPAARRPGSADRPRPVTSNSSGSRACTARGSWTW